MSLGGVRDEAEIRGHRRTYIGALPGRLVRALRDAGTMNPVIMLDEVDKIGADWRGDPSSALLEVLDPAQNHSFRDHYLDVELDLSQVLFIATANVADTIPGPLLDRMEIIRFDGYTMAEKMAIARGYLWPRQVERNGLRPDEVTIDDAVLRLVVSRLHARGRRAAARARARHAAAQDRDAHRLRARRRRPSRVDVALVRDALGRQKFFQEAVERTAVPGVATGLAVTGTGGDVLFVEAASMPGNGGLVLTGQLGDVMKESARIALTYVRSHAAALGIRTTPSRDSEFHVHVPAGAIPKDGPSAGVTMVTAIVSLLTRRPVKHTVGMTGEVTLQGRVLPIGGVKQKVLAAHAAGLTEVILPERNRGDLDEVPADVREQMRFHPVSSVDEVLRAGARVRRRRAGGVASGSGCGRAGERAPARERRAVGERVGHELSHAHPERDAVARAARADDHVRCAGHAAQHRRPVLREGDRTAPALAERDAGQRRVKPGDARLEAAEGRGAVGAVQRELGDVAGVARHQAGAEHDASVAQRAAPEIRHVEGVEGRAVAEAERGDGGGLERLGAHRQGERRREPHREGDERRGVGVQRHEDRIGEQRCAAHPQPGRTPRLDGLDPRVLVQRRAARSAARARPATSAPGSMVPPGTVSSMHSQASPSRQNGRSAPGASRWTSSQQPGSVRSQSILASATTAASASRQCSTPSSGPAAVPSSTMPPVRPLAPAPSAVASRTTTRAPRRAR